MINDKGILAVLHSCTNAFYICLHRARSCLLLLFIGLFSGFLFGSRLTISFKLWPWQLRCEVEQSAVSVKKKLTQIRWSSNKLRRICSRFSASTSAWWHNRSSGWDPSLNLGLAAWPRTSSPAWWCRGLFHHPQLKTMRAKDSKGFNKDYSQQT